MPTDVTDKPVVPSRLRLIRVAVPDAVHYDREKMAEAMKKILGQLGHPQCHSGFDIRFIRETEFNVLERGGALELHSNIGRVGG